MTSIRPVLRSRVTLPQAALINERAPVKPPVPVDDTAAESAPVGDPLTSTVDLPGTSHGGNESEKADKVAIGFHIGYRGCFLGERTLYRPAMASIGLLNVPKDSMGCLDNIQHPKSTKYSSYKY